MSQRGGGYIVVFGPAGGVDVEQILRPADGYCQISPTAVLVDTAQTIGQLTAAIESKGSRDFLVLPVAGTVSGWAADGVWEWVAATWGRRR